MVTDKLGTVVLQECPPRPGPLHEDVLGAHRKATGSLVSSGDRVSLTRLGLRPSSIPSVRHEYSEESQALAHSFFPHQLQRGGLGLPGLTSVQGPRTAGLGGGGGETGKSKALSTTLTHSQVRTPKYRNKEARFMARSRRDSSRDRGSNWGLLFPCRSSSDRGVWSRTGSPAWVPSSMEQYSSWVKARVTPFLPLQLPQAHFLLKVHFLVLALPAPPHQVPTKCHFGLCNQGISV